MDGLIDTSTHEQAHNFLGGVVLLLPEGNSLEKVASGSCWHHHSQQLGDSTWPHLRDVGYVP